MRPVALSLQAFGSYPGLEHVDFTDLAELGLFVVTGPTGSGKTTLFDAMTFALYGTVPGDRPDGDVRSHHAADDTPTEVTLVFDLDGQRYRVWRRPQQVRPRRSGRGVREVPAEAELHRLDGDTWVPVETSVLKVQAACVELVGLKAEQFQKVVLLPQGRFAEFLLATSRHREDLLRQLFGTTHLARATQSLLDRARRLATQVHEVTAEVGHHRRAAIEAVRRAHATLEAEVGSILVGARVALTDLEVSGQASLFDPPLDTAGGEGAAGHVGDLLDDSADIVDVTRALDAVGRALERLDALAEEAVARAAGARDHAARAGDAAQRFDQHRAAQATLARLLVDEAERERDALVVDAGRRARPVVAADADLARCTLDLDAARRDADDAHTRVAALLDAAGHPPVASPDEAVRAAAVLAATLAEHHTLLARIDDLDADLHAARSQHHDMTAAVATLAERSAAAEAQRDPLSAEIEALAAATADLPALSTLADERRRLVVAAERRDDAARRLGAALDAATQAEEAESAALRAYAGAAAPRLAATLVEGEPCLVCGSPQHPAPAAGDDTTLVDERHLDAARAATVEAHRRRTELTTALRLARDDMGEHADRPLDDIRGEADDATDQLQTAMAAARTLEARRGDLQRLEVALTDARTQIAAAAEEAAAAEARVTMLAQQLADEQAAASGIDRASLAEQSVIVRRLDVAAQSWSTHRTQLDRRSAEADQATRTVAELLAVSGFADVRQAHAAFVSDEEHDRLATRLDIWTTELDRTRTTIDLLRAQGVPDERPDLDTVLAQCAHAEHEAARLTAAVHTTRHSLAAAQQSLSVAVQVGDESADLRAEAALVDRVAQVCSAQAAPRISLETWVLARELERVAQAANVHLARLTAGRYSLHTLDGGGEVDQRRRVGLDLVVFDAHTGRERSPRTLSGGEQFQAALALALGLADVVSRGGTGSGKVFEALFVDEGFGSLDPDALDDAIDALAHLQAGGRMVGVITHVEAMKQQLPAGVQVLRRSDGRGSTLRSA
jgi:exonuclease SbcC